MNDLGADSAVDRCKNKGAQKYINGDAFKKDVPGLEEVIVMKDASHFINQERPHEINCHIHDFFNKFC
ncbi:unnamed protein product [Citrullus colocynthis]|uniref:Uncharacterized protein n=1 Tax=Citrullus colocynthis TaxID=252529 RepID=A0ABP0YSQ6_9ROSI